MRKNIDRTGFFASSLLFRGCKKPSYCWRFKRDKERLELNGRQEDSAIEKYLGKIDIGCKTDE